MTNRFSATGSGVLLILGGLGLLSVCLTEELLTCSLNNFCQVEGKKGRLVFCFVLFFDFFLFMSAPVHCSSLKVPTTEGPFLFEG